LTKKLKVGEKRQKIEQDKQNHQKKKW